MVSTKFKIESEKAETTIDLDEKNSQIRFENNTMITTIPATVTIKCPINFEKEITPVVE
jgi:hypothetical protein